MLGGYIGAGPGKLLERDIVLVEMQYRWGNNLTENIQQDFVSQSGAAGVHVPT